MSKFEQASPKADVSPVDSTSHDYSRVMMEHARTTEPPFRFTSNDNAQKTVDKKFGTPEIEGLDGSSKNFDDKPTSQKNASSRGEHGIDGVTNEGSEYGIPGGQSAGDGAASQHDTSSGKAEESESNYKNGKQDAHEKELTPTADDLKNAAEVGKLTETLVKAGVDVNDEKAVEDFLSKAFDDQVIRGLTLSNVKLPPNPTDSDLGKALLPFVQRSPKDAMNSAAEKQINIDPGEGYASTRQVFLNIQKQSLQMEKKN